MDVSCFECNIEILSFWGSSTHCARTVHLFHVGNLLDAIVLLHCCPVRCCVAELVPHFTLYELRIAILYAIFLSFAQQHNVFILGSSRYHCFLQVQQRK